MNSEQEVEACCETFEFKDQEMCSLKAHFEAMEQELKDTRTELVLTLKKWDSIRRKGWTT